MAFLRLLTATALILTFGSVAVDDDKQSNDTEILQLIDKLTTVTDYRLQGIYGHTLGNLFLPLDGKRDEGDFQLEGPSLRGYDIVRELVSRGPAAIPHLVGHLDDRRPTPSAFPIILDPPTFMATAMTSIETCGRT